jgi:hypothetical protein
MLSPYAFANASTSCEYGGEIEWPLEATTIASRIVHMGAGCTRGCPRNDEFCLLKKK